MLTSSNQYLRPDYLSPLPTTLDAKKSPLALLAQTCSAIGADSPNPKLVSAAERGSKRREDKSPVTVSVASDTKPSFKPYESCLSAAERAGGEESERSPADPAPGTPAPTSVSPPVRARCASSHSSSSQRASPNARRSPSGKSEGAPSPARSSPAPTKIVREPRESVFKPSAPHPPAALHPPTAYPLPAELMAAHHHALKGGFHPYLAYARLKAASTEPCRDPYCAGCSLSAHAHALRAAGGACPAGCVSCEHGKALSLPYVCSWLAADAPYCGKRFSSSEELLGHLRAHAAAGEALAHPLLSRFQSPLSLSPLSQMSPLSPRFHPYAKPTPGSLPLSALSPSLAAYFPPYSLLPRALLP